jgi:hypothetical protein
MLGFYHQVCHIIMRLSSHAVVKKFSGKQIL